MKRLFAGRLFAGRLFAGAEFRGSADVTTPTSHVLLDVTVTRAVEFRLYVE